MSKLRGADRRYLRSQAHHLQPVVQIGKQGLTERVLATIDENLSAHELIKIRFGDFKDQKKTLTAQIADELGAEVAGVIGHIAILYRAHPEAGKRKIRLPKRAAVVPAGAGQPAPASVPQSGPALIPASTSESPPTSASDSDVEAGAEVDEAETEG